MTTQPTTPTMPEVLEAWIDQATANLRVAMPGIVQTFDREKQRISVQPCIMDGFVDESNDRSVERLPVINEVPVLYPRASGISMFWPLQKGDLVMLFFSSSSLDRWKERGGVVDPGDDRRHALSDAVAWAGIGTAKDAIPASGTHETALVISAPEIHAGGTSALALHQKLEALASWAANHEHPGDATPPSSGPPSMGDGTAVLKGG
jgi:hypothetical protein